jgi:hypothetical protein
VYCVAGAVALLILSLFTYCCCCRKKKQQLRDEALRFMPLDATSQPQQQQQGHNGNANAMNLV